MNLLATLPAVHQAALLRRITAHPAISGVRYNVGARSPYPPRETLERVLAVTEAEGKALWVDLKGRQLRILQWAVPTYGDIVLNHEIEVERPARITFRGGEWSEIVEVRGNRVYVDPPPSVAVGQGQAVNVQAAALVIHGYLSEEDEAYLEACRALGIDDIMLSFVEDLQDVASVRERLPGVRPVLKIESLRGLDLLRTAPPEALEGMRVMAARDDLMVNIGPRPAAMLPALDQIIRRDHEAICASRLLLGVERGGGASMADISDLRLMESLGYRTFLLSDGICQRHFDAAVTAWEDYRAVVDAEAE
jgi:pyruvate kinase